MLSMAAAVAGTYVWPARAAQPATPAASPALFQGETFVGLAEDGQTFVAVVVTEGDRAQREARAYLCNGLALDVWLTGTVDGDATTLEAEDGSTLTASLGEEAVAGELTLADGTTLAFETIPAEGAAGLYSLSIAEDGTIQGQAADGQGFAWGWVATAPLLGSDAAYPVILQLAPAGGGSASVLAGMTEPGQAGEGRLVVLADGPLAGAGRTKQGSKQFVWYDVDF
jgi:hypothetical protein